MVLRRARSTPRHRTCCALALVLLAFAVGGCGDADVPARSFSASDPEREYEVAADKNATAEEIIEAGGPVRVARSGAGTEDRMLVAWRAESDDDEGPQQAAWRLYDGGGERVADGRLGQVSEAGAIPTLTAVPDGFLLENYTGHPLRHIDPDGTITNVPSSAERKSAEPGDVLMESLERNGSRIYRPGERTAYRLPKLPFRSPQGVALDAHGTLWVLLSWTDRTAPVASSPGGAGPWTRTAVPLRKGGMPQGIAVAGERVVVPTASGSGPNPRIDGLWTRPVDAAPRAAWTREPTDAVRLRQTLQAEIDTLPDGRVALSGGSEPAWLQHRDGTWARLRPPAGAGNGYLQIAGSTLFWIFTRDRQLHESDDDGATWRVVHR